VDKEIQYAPQRAIESSIIEIRGSKVILDTDLAAIYGVQTFRFNEAVKRILKRPRAVQISVFVVRAFVKMREMLIEQRDLAKKLEDLEERLTERLDIHETAIVEVLRQVMTLLTPPQNPPIKPKKKIGFQVKEGRAVYSKRTKRKKIFN